MTSQSIARHKQAKSNASFPKRNTEAEGHWLLPTFVLKSFVGDEHSCPSSCPSLMNFSMTKVFFCTPMKEV